MDAVVLERERRQRKTIKPQVIDNTPHDDAAKPVFGARGSITVVYGLKGSEALRQAEKAVREGGPALKEFVERLTRQLLARGEKPLTSAAMAKEIVGAEAFADVRHGSDTLNSGLYLPRGLDVFFVQFPYNGGGMAREGILLTQYVKGGAKAELDAFVVKVDPVLTPAERAALKEISPEALAANIGSAMDCETTYFAVAVVAVCLAAAAAVGVAEVATAAWAVCQAVCGNRAMDKLHIAESQLRAIGPEASALQLLNIRRSVLLNETPQVGT